MAKGQSRRIEWGLLSRSTLGFCKKRATTVIVVGRVENPNILHDGDNLA